MTAIEVKVFSDAESLGSALAQEIIDGIDLATANRKDYVLGCPGGRSPRTTYLALAALVRQRATDLSHVVIAMMDDYVVSDGKTMRSVDPSSHFSVMAFAQNEIVAPLNSAAPKGCGISADRLWLPDPSDPNAYERKLEDAGGIDLFILASGDSDGHVAFNPPGSDSSSRTRIIELAESTRRDNLNTFPEFKSLDEVPLYGISVGLATIREFSHRTVLLAPGPSKAQAVMRIKSATELDPAWPATILAECQKPSLYTDQSTPSIGYSEKPSTTT